MKKIFLLFALFLVICSPAIARIDFQPSTVAGVENGGTGTSTVFTQGSVVFAGASGIYSQDNPGLTYDSTTNVLTEQNDALANTSTDGILLQNTTAATGGTTVQISPRLRFRGMAWNSSGSASETQDWYIENLPATAAGTTTSTLRFARSVNGGANTLVASFSSAGNLSMSGAGEFRTSTGSNAAYTGNGVRAGALTSAVSLGYAGSSSSYSAEVVAYGITHSTTPGILQFRTGTASAQQSVVWTMDANGHLLTGTDNTEDIGASGATRPRTIYLGTSLDVGGSKAVIGSSGTVTKYNNISTAGGGVPAIYGSGRSTAQTAAVGTVATYTVGAADATFEVSANVLVTTATTHSFTVTCAYTDEGNTARTVTLPFTLVAGSAIVNTVANGNGAVPYMGIPLKIRAKAGTAITIATTGTFTTVTYNVEGSIIQL